MDVLVGNLLKAFDVSIDELAWMGPETKQEAHDKVRNFTVKIGYPTKWKDYTGLVDAARTTCSATCCARVK